MRRLERHRRHPGPTLPPRVSAAIPPDNSIMQSLWIGKELSVLEQLSIRSFLANGHTFHLYLYGPCAGVPAGAVVKDANEIIPQARIAAYREPHIFSDHFRYLLLQQRERWWVDADVICLRPFDFTDPYVFASEIINDSSDFPPGYMLVNQCVMKAPADSELLKRYVAFCEQQDPMTFRGERGGDIGMGPELATNLTAELGLRQYVQARDVFAPIRCQRVVQDCTDARLESNLSASYAVHLFQSQWGASKNSTYGENCLYEKLKRRYV